MSFETNVRNLAQRVGNESKALRTLLNGNRADNANLTTTAKASLVAAINELHALINAASSGTGNINDSATSSGATWSSQKVADSLAALKAEIMGPNVNAALDTLKEIGDLLTSNGGAIEAITSGLSKRVRVDEAQSLTTAEQLQARQNIGAVASADIGDTTRNFVTVFETALAS